MTRNDIQATQQDFTNAALNARNIGFDGIEIHGGNGYLLDQFHQSNSALRTGKREFDPSLLTIYIFSQSADRRLRWQY